MCTLNPSCHPTYCMPVVFNSFIAFFCVCLFFFFSLLFLVLYFATVCLVHWVRDACTQPLQRNVQFVHKFCLQPTTHQAPTTTQHTARCVFFLSTHTTCIYGIACTSLRRTNTKITNFFVSLSFGHTRELALVLLRDTNAIKWLTNRANTQ